MHQLCPSTDFQRLKAELFLVGARGISMATRQGLQEALTGEIYPQQLAPLELYSWAVSAVGAKALRRVVWPTPESLDQALEFARATGTRLLWRGGENWPSWLDACGCYAFVSGNTERLWAPHVTVVGSRTAEAEILEAVRKLCRVLSERGTAFASGGATGVDSAAQRGAVEGAAGALVLPAIGLAKAKPSAGTPGVTAIGLEPLYAGFSSGAAIRRNHVLAEIGECVVLGASGLRGGSTYAVKRAMELGKPVWAFEAGAKTPAANQQLLRSGAANALRLGDGPEVWAGAIMDKMQRRRARPAAAHHRTQGQFAFPA